MLLVVCVAIALSFILIYSRKNYFVNKNYYAAPNTTRGFALIADFIVFNSINFVYILSKFLLCPEYRPEFQAFADHIFHNSGDGLGDWFGLNQVKFLGVYTIYSFLTELSPLKSTLLGKFFGLKIEIEEGRNPFISILLRNLIKPVSIMFFPVFMLLSYFNSDRKWIHDIVAGTKVKHSI